MEDHSKSLVSHPPKDVMVSKLLFKADHSEFQSMLTNGAAMPLVFSATVEKVLITMFYLSESPALIGKLKTHGAHLGEKEDSLDSRQETLVVSAKTNPHGSNDHQNTIKL